MGWKTTRQSAGWQKRGLQRRGQQWNKSLTWIDTALPLRKKQMPYKHVTVQSAKHRNSSSSLADTSVSQLKRCGHFGRINPNEIEVHLERNVRKATVITTGPEIAISKGAWMHWGCLVFGRWKKRGYIKTVFKNFKGFSKKIRGHCSLNPWWIQRGMWGLNCRKGD